jgi:hypothetical protein
MIRVGNVLLLAILILTCGRTQADEVRSHLAHPKGTSLVLLDVSRKEGLSARFAGHTWIRGTLHGRWPGGRDTKFDLPEYLLIPDAGSVAQLPYFYFRDAGHTKRYRVASIQLVNGEQALREAAGRARADQLVQRRTDSVHVTGDFLVEAYEVGVECDAPWAKARFVRARIPDQAAALRQELKESC